MLKNLEILNGSISPVFDSSINNYEVQVSDTVFSLVMEYETDESSKVTVYGNDNLVSGENHVLLEIYDGKEVKTYNLTVYKGINTTIKNNNEYAKIEVTGKTYNNTVIQNFIVIGTIIVIIILYRAIFKLRK